METEQKTILYKKKGQTQGAVGAIISLIVGVGIAVLVILFVGVLGGKSYSISESKINALYGTVNNETWSATANTAHTLNNDVLSKVSVFNATDPYTELANTQYHVGTSSGIITINDTGFNTFLVGANYTYGDPNIQGAIKGSISSGSVSYTHLTLPTNREV